MSQAMYIYSADKDEAEQTFLATVFTTKPKAKEMLKVWAAEYGDIVVVDEDDNVVVSTEQTDPDLLSRSGSN